MPRKIILDETMLYTKISNAQPYDTCPTPNNGNDCIKDDLITYSDILKATIAQYPNKMLFSIKDTAIALSVSPEFIRKKISDGCILSVTLGDRKMISINQLATIIYKGV